MPNFNLKVEVSCPNCNLVRLARGDIVRKAQREGKELWCLPCRNKTKIHKPTKYVGTELERKRQAAKQWKINNPDKVANKRYKARYGITLIQYQSKLTEQNNKCLICNIDEKETKHKKLVVDHNHKTGEVRGLLCHNCNCALGHFKDSIQILKNALNYLIKLNGDS